jgi:hypothetical protein
MRCRVLLMRCRGRRLLWRDIANGSAYEGDLTTHYMTLQDQRYFVATLMQPGDPLWREVLPRLFEPVLTNLGRGVLVLRASSGLRNGAKCARWFKSGVARLLVDA